jgi:hypothetical protein
MLTENVGTIREQSMAIKEGTKFAGEATAESRFGLVSHHLST